MQFKVIFFVPWAEKNITTAHLIFGNKFLINILQIYKIGVVFIV
jgi:hypothetical protein